MSDGSSFLLARIIMFSLVSAADISILGLSGHIIALSDANGYEDIAFAELAVSISVLTLSVPAILLLQSFRRHAITVITEVSWLGFLFLAWVASAGLSMSSAVCDLSYEPRWYKQVCKETGALAGLSFFIVAALISYVSTLVTLSTISRTHGSSVWRSSVPTAKFKLAAVPVRHEVSV
ncbi:hypothetical protein PsYK624_109080 [Phanerochaete sordida]|uniref:MARVEL domain-containing protein n=1 Tax=Phanerochaete sordida TaxID=48140 RepID=A0A9P3LI26_9APHY|nr:hypothetical protein PsYK624_109080 [Phanerochaete sordida]